MAEKDLFRFEPHYEIPADPVGTRPPGEGRCGPARLLWLTLVAVRYHFWRVAQFGFLAMLFCLIPLIVAGLVGGWLVQAGLKWAGSLPMIATWPILIPMFAGLESAVLLLVQGYRPPWYEVVRPMLNLRLYVNVLMAGLPRCALMWGASFGLMLAGAGPWLGDLAGGEAWGKWLGCLPRVVLSNLVALPFVFAGLDAVAAWSPFGRSLRRNLCFVRRDPWLLLGFGLVQIGLGAAPALMRVLLSQREGWLPEGALWFAMLIFGALAVGLVVLAVLTVAPPVFYREFVWRERAAAASSPGAA